MGRNGFGEGNDAEYDEDDKEADAVWDEIDKRMELRRKHRRDARLKEEIEKYRASNLNITEQFAELKRKLERLSASEWDSIALDLQTPDSVSGQTIFNPKGYLTDLKSLKITSDAEVSDIKKARQLFKSVIQTNPKHPPGWIGAARLEEVAGKILIARELINKGCEECPKDEGVWIEACRLANPDEAKGVIASGVKANPNSVELWMQAANLEHDNANKSEVLKKGLEKIPDSVRLWKAVVELANEDDAKLLLQRAVECCPLHVELWLALAKLETHDRAKKVLNKAREKLPKEPKIWIEAAKLEEAYGNTSMVGKIVERGIRALRKEGVEIVREAWMKEAEAAERAGSVATCNAIVSNTLGIGVEEEDFKATWDAEAEECKKRGLIETARAIYSFAIARQLKLLSLGKEENAAEDNKH